MPEIPAQEIGAFGRFVGEVSGLIRPAAKYLGIGAAGLAIGYGGSLFVNSASGFVTAKGLADNPPLQTTPVPQQGQVAAFDPKTGTLVLLGQGPPAQQVTGPTRAVEDTVQKGLMYAALAAAGVAAIVIFGRK